MMTDEQKQILLNETRITSETGGQKGVKPARMDLIDPYFLWELSNVCGMGSAKYDDDNWRKGYPWKYSIGAMLRHIMQWLMGEEKDKESGLHHLAHAAWHCMALMVFSTDKKYEQYDTRNNPCDRT